MNLRSFKSPEDVKATGAVLLKDTQEGVGRMRNYAGKPTDAQIKEVVARTRTVQKQPTEPLPARPAPLGPPPGRGQNP